MCIDKTKDFRQEEYQLFSFIKPYKALTRQSVSRWILEVSGQAGIDTKTYSGHSSRPDLSSKAKSSGVPMGEILKKVVLGK